MLSIATGMRLPFTEVTALSSSARRMRVAAASASWMTAPGLPRLTS
jgi:hypothetical protein